MAKRRDVGDGEQSVDVDHRDVVQVGLVEVAKVELALGRSPGWGWLGRFCGQAQVVEDLYDGVGIVDVADTVHL